MRGGEEERKRDRNHSKVHHTCLGMHFLLRDHKTLAIQMYHSLDWVLHALSLKSNKCPIWSFSFILPYPSSNVWCLVFPTSKLQPSYDLSEHAKKLQRGTPSLVQYQTRTSFSRDDSTTGTFPMIPTTSGLDVDSPVFYPPGRALTPSVPLVSALKHHRRLGVTPLLGRYSARLRLHVFALLVLVLVLIGNPSFPPRPGPLAPLSSSSSSSLPPRSTNNFVSTPSSLFPGFLTIIGCVILSIVPS
ncbi:hypothetical protein SODALDRAFT_363583 [Sodiomyces alkalinus F11]|uniref:Uncharacterized protein n=1 Tax=Sodiomyces alkalinus (strain CBS 110278 / VKM F-3762 / F11) TaxID=1314773 RepID=A0A3N2PKG7_SODAK|nr:hypothetical protein SODALDRAFT_363583 [Sodiomyces alkalinus F11]ROT34894.1 hypothetical protein SODALDRAFT_363583 [Sodiomyces alkalinus F11]